MDLDVRGPKRGGIAAPYLLGVLGTFTPEGMRIRTVVPGTPAAQAGLASGDFIVRFNGQFVSSQGEMFVVLDSSGGTAVLDVRKGGAGRIARVEVPLALHRMGVLGEPVRDGFGVEVVSPKTPADRAGLQPGDVILQADGRPVKTQQDISTAVDRSGGTLTLAVRRGAVGPVRVDVELVNNPLGAWCEKVAEGMRVTSVAPGSTADLIGLQRGDIIIKVDDQRVRSQAELLRALGDSGGLVTLTVRKGDTGRAVRIDADLSR
jgi:S1-C subfamily serine protease